MFLILPEEGFSALLRLDFSHDNRTYVWNTSLDCGRQVGQGLSWGFSGAINSMLIKNSVFSKNQDRWQEDGKVGISLNYALTSRLKIGAAFSQNINSLEKRKVASSEYGITSEYEISSIKFVQVLGGKDIDRRLEKGARKDVGLNHRLTLSQSPRLFSESATRISFSQTSSRLSNIPLLERDFDIYFTKSLAEEDSLEFLYHEGWARKKFYQGDLTDPQISTQRRTKRVINLRSSIRVPSDIKVGFDFDFALNGYRYSGAPASGSAALTDNSFSSQSVRLEVQRDFFKRISMRTFYKYDQTEEDYANDQKDQKMKGGELGGGLRFKISQADSLCLTASAGVTSFYTQAVSAHFNDRDILTLFAWGEYLHIFSSIFSLRLEAGFRNFHQVYISDRLSANNNHNQTYVLSPTLFWRPHAKVDFKQNYNIQANYIYYDYEKSMESTRNRLFRRGSSSSSLSYRFLSRVGFVFGYVYRYEDYGQLIWRDQWVQKPSWERRTHSFNFKVNYTPARNLSFSPEYTYEKRRSWDHSTDVTTEKRIRTLRDEFYRNMISVSCKYLVSDRNYISLSGAHRVQKSTLSSKETTDYAAVSVSRIF
ncbi:MAG: hypothetical protein GTO24_23200 [candidate division Zixibacteria bacterium]|nr:hypothetical protein [candidate division Zixibacteria bacterium]